MEGSRAQSFDINNEKLRCIQHGKTPASKNPVTIDYFGHSCIRITSPQGISVLIDPWRNDAAWGWWFPVDFPEISVDLALSTHAHFDHDAVHMPKALMTMERMIGTYTLGDLRITGFADKHVSYSAGKTRWTEIQKDTGENFSPPNNNLHMDNCIYLIETGGVNIVHWGDNRPLPDTFIDNVLTKTPIDVLFIPIDESEHILNYDEADALMTRYTPGVTIPIHYLLHGANTALSTLQPSDPWVFSHKNPLEIGSSQLSVKAGQFQQTGTLAGTFGNQFTRK